MSRGGARIGAGRPKGQGRFKEKTKAIRIPESMEDEVLGFIANKGLQLPLYISKIVAGLPTLIEDHIDVRVDLNELLVKNPSHSFLVRVSGESMINAGIQNNDILIVDCRIEPEDGKIVIASLDGEFTVKRLKKTKCGQVFLMPENKSFAPIEIKPESNIHIFGIVTNVIHHVK
jgi:DNA polymerase V